jgi:hypothetical protein
MRTTEIVIDSVLVRVVDRATPIPERVDEIASDLGRKSSIPKLCHIRQELRIVADRRVGHLESPRRAAGTRC